MRTERGLANESASDANRSFERDRASGSQDFFEGVCCDLAVLSEQNDFFVGEELHAQGERTRTVFENMDAFFERSGGRGERESGGGRRGG